MAKNSAKERLSYSEKALTEFVSMLKAAYERSQSENIYERRRGQQEWLTLARMAARLHLHSPLNRVFLSLETDLERLRQGSPPHNEIINVSTLFQSLADGFRSLESEQPVKHSPPYYVAVVGANCSGKGLIAQQLAQYGFQTFPASDNLTHLLSSRLLPDFGDPKMVFDGLHSDAEVEVFRQLTSAGASVLLLGVTTGLDRSEDFETRFQRAVKRAGYGDPQRDSPEEREKFAQHDSAEAAQLERLMLRADHYVINVGEVGNAQAQVKGFLEQRHFIEKLTR